MLTSLKSFKALSRSNTNGSLVWCTSFSSESPSADGCLVLVRDRIGKASMSNRMPVMSSGEFGLNFSLPSAMVTTFFFSDRFLSITHCSFFWCTNRCTKGLD
ncbi:hypothetical protein D3C87_1599630 [compost metagenome]